MQYDLHKMTGDELTALHNHLNPTKPIQGRWKGAKLKLVERIEGILQEAKDAPDRVEPLKEMYDKGLASLGSEEPAQTAPEPVTEEPEPEAKVEETLHGARPHGVIVDEVEEAPAPDPVKEVGFSCELTDEDRARLPEKGKTIRETALRLLTFVHYHEDTSKAYTDDNRVPADHKKAGSVGLTYPDIITLIKSHFIGCKTTVACLRWYAVKVRAEEKGYEGWRLTRRRPRVLPPKPAKATA